MLAMLHRGITATAFVLLLTGCHTLGITSSVKTTFTEETLENGTVVTKWTMFVKNGIWSYIGEEVMQTMYQIDKDGVQTITQGTSISEMDSTGQIEGIKSVADIVTTIADPIGTFRFP